MESIKIIVCTSFLTSSIILSCNVLLVKYFYNKMKIKPFLNLFDNKEEKYVKIKRRR